MKSLILSLSLLLMSSQALAWGRRAHADIASLAAQLISKEQAPKEAFLMDHSYDLGYYANIPDFVWKATPEIYKKEQFQHYIDLPIFDREFAARGEKPDWNPDRTKFFTKFSNIPTNAGRAPWRIQELTDQLSEFTKKLKNKKISVAERRDLQGQWLLYAGVIGHYIGDLSMPLHVSEDYDAKKAGQGGLHSWFEDKMPDELYPSIENEVLTRARARWKEFQKENAKKTAFELALDLGRNSEKVIPELLKIDKTNGRKSNSKAAEAYKEMLTQQLTTGVLYLALAWSPYLGWNFDGNRFFTWYGQPEYINAPAEPRLGVK